MPKNKLIDLSSLNIFKTNIKSFFINLTGDLTSLNTIKKNNLVDAINEINGEISNVITTGIVGEIKSYMGTTPPESFLSCDGEVYNIADYPYLTQHFLINFGSVNFFGGDGETTFAVPDLRGEFLRGTGTNGHANQGSGAEVGVHQDGTVFPKYGASNSSGYISRNNVPYNEDLSFGSNEYYSFSSSYSDTTGKSFTARPTNTSVLYCIRYKPAFMVDNEGMLELEAEINAVRQKTVTVKNLLATEEGQPLDATQGKVLDDKVENLTWRSYEGTLPAGSTTITIPIGSYNENSSAYFQTDIYGTALLAVEFKTEESGNSCVLTFEAQSKDMRVVVNIK